ncbi:hypothetical protein D3C78_1373040 [compost metagenome]
MLEHGLEQVGLVLEVPVERAAGHAGGAGDLLKGGVGHALFEKQLFGGSQQGAARLLGFFFGAAHPVPRAKTHIGGGGSRIICSGYLQACLNVSKNDGFPCIATALASPVREF